ncbi:agmatine deiminase family protein [Phaeobacter sp. NW0010-22]
MALSNTGFRVPPEELRHQRTFMQWPVIKQVYGRGRFLRDVQATIAEIANTIAEFEPVTMLAPPAHHSSARKLLSNSVTLWDIPTDDLWCRDSGPLFAKNATGQLAVHGVNFNGWGGRYPLRNDEHIAIRVADRLGLPYVDSGLVGEPGGVESDGHGLLMANESSWVNSNRNPGLSREEIERRLLTAYGADKMIWGKGVKGQDVTDDHIDGLARFTGKGQVLMMLDPEPLQNDPYSKSAYALRKRLIDAGLSVETITPGYDGRIRDVDAMSTYPNYYVCNGAVIASHTGDSYADPRARDALSSHYPGREIIMLNTDVLGELGGGIHCATQQMPA